MGITTQLSKKEAVNPNIAGLSTMAIARTMHRNANLSTGALTVMQMIMQTTFAQKRNKECVWWSLGN